MGTEVRETAGCACVSHDAIECVRKRYPETYDRLDDLDASPSDELRQDRCECPCHDEYRQDNPERWEDQP